MSNHHHDEGHDVNMEHVGHHGNAFENRDLGGRGIIVFLIVLVVSGVVLCLMVWGYYGWHAKHMAIEAPVTGVQQLSLTPEQMVDPTKRFPKPTLQPDDVADMNKFRADEAAVLNSYGWVDRNAGVVHIPVDEAIKAVAKQGLPVRPAQQPVPKAEFGSGVDSPAGFGGGTRPMNRQ